MVDQATINAALQPLEDIRADAGLCHWTHVATAIGQARRVLADSPDSKVVDRIAELEAALQPFADEAASYDPDTGDGDEIVWATPTSFKIRDLRRAREVLAAKEASDV